MSKPIKIEEKQKKMVYKFHSTQEMWNAIKQIIFEGKLDIYYEVQKDNPKE